MSGNSKSSRIEEANWDSLPPDIRTDILLRLPIKTILSCTSVSKSWNSLIKSPNFISTHLNRNATHLLFLREVGFYYKAGVLREIYKLHWDNEEFREYKRFDFPLRAQGTDRVFRVVGTCNGLVCLADDFPDYCNFFVWNPRIRKYVILPTLFVNCGYYNGSGFGFDSKTNDYKVVRIVTNIDEQSKGEPEVKVYSLATGEWKTVSAVPPKCTLDGRDNRPAFLNGAIHWAAHDGFHNFILGFDLGDEKFREIMLPNDLLIDNCLPCFSWCGLSVSVYGESLVVYRRLIRYPCIHIWVMKEYGVLESWTKVQGPEVEVPHIFDSDRTQTMAVGFRKSGEVIIETEHRQLVSLDPESKKIKDLINPKYGYRFDDDDYSGYWSDDLYAENNKGYGYTFVDPHVESLVLLDNSQGVVSYQGTRMKWKNKFRFKRDGQR